jgi:hypothetical protein
MPRRTPFTQAEIDERRRRWHDAPLPSDDDLDHLARLAKIPAARRSAFISELKDTIRLNYLDKIVSEQEEPSRQAEALQQVIDAARNLEKAIEQLPGGLRVRIEPDMLGSVRRSVDVEVRELLLNDPEISAAWSENRPLVEGIINYLAGQYEKHLDGGWHMPGFDTFLAELIEKATAECRRWDRRASQPWSRQRKLHRRDILARDLKALVMTHSPSLGKNGAEEWVASALDVLEIGCPQKGTASFRQMFAVNRSPPPDHVERFAAAPKILNNSK